MFFEDDFFESFREMQRKMDKMYREIFKGEKWDLKKPSTDLIDEGDKIVLKANLPGVKKEDMNIHATEDSLEINVSSKKEMHEQKKNYYKQERSALGYHRYVKLPEKIIPEKTRAKCEDGVLEITMEKAEKKKSGKKIKVKVN